MKQLFSAAFVAPMDAAVLRDAGVVVEAGRVVEVGATTALRQRHPEADVTDFGGAVILPGLVNAHTHLELSACHSGDSPDGHFGDWILSIRERLAAVHEDPSVAVERGVREGIEQSLRFGVTTVGDISQQFHLTRPILRASELRAVSYGEAIGLALRRPRFDELLAAAVTTDLMTDRLRIGLSPHAPYTVDAHGYRQALALARRHGLPIATHLAETPDEADFLLHQRGVFRQIWETLGFWGGDVPLVARSPITMASELGLLDHPTLLAHVNYCTDEELAMLSKGRASVVYCPRTHRYFGHPPHRWREMLAAGINVALGTDSCASSPDLNLLDDLRLVHQLSPEVDVDVLWRLITLNAARALEWSHEIGSLTPGKRADLCVFDVRTSDPLREILQSPALPRAVLVM